VREFLVSKQITVLEHSPSSPDLSPKDFFLFLNIKKILKGRHFDDIDDMRSNMTATLKAIPQNQFQNCFEGLTRRCIASQGEYFKGTTVIFSKEVSSRTLLSDHVCATVS
jgi:histone-lysine N-methyltransferase SETMAR